jgi:amino acid transporter
MGSGSFLGDLAQARRLGMGSSSGFGPTVLAGLAAGLTLFFGYFHATNFSQEVKDPQKNLLRGSWSALLVAWAVLALSAVFVQRLIPSEWLAAQAYLARTAEFENTAMPWLPYYAMLVNPNPLLFWMLAGAWIVPSLALAYTFLYAGSRVIKAWTDDGLLPSGANFVHPVLRSPLIAVLLVSILAEAGLVFAALDGQILARINPVFFIACVQVLPVLALIMLPYRKKEWFDQAPLALRRKIGSLPLVSLVGSFSLLYLIGTIVSMLLFPSLQAINQGTLVLFALLFASGLVWFFVQQSYNPAAKETQLDWPAELPER